MRFNKSELASLVINPAIKFDREGLLIITERQEGFFRRTAEVNYPRWCKLRGNLLFYLKDHDPLSLPTGVIVLENCRPLIRSEESEFDGFAFILEFEGSFPQRICTRTAKERLEWVNSIQLASYSNLNRQISYLSKQISSKMGNRIEKGTPLYMATTVDDTTLMDTHVEQRANVPTYIADEDLCEVPICESAISCDRLPVGNNGRQPNPRVVISTLMPSLGCVWREHAHTETTERTTSPQFLCTVRFRRSDGFTADSLLRFTVYDVREQFTATTLPLGYTEVVLGAIQDVTHFRMPLQTLNDASGFITIASWTPDVERQGPPRSTTQVFEQPTRGHRRSQSLPPKLGAKLFVPPPTKLQCVFANPLIHTYRLHSSIGGDISVHESMLESKLSLAIPQQLLSIWILREKELLQEISGMGELGGEWRRRQMDLLDKHLKLLTEYSQTRQCIQQLSKEDSVFFKRSPDKGDESLEFLPVNLHLQRMCVQNDALNKRGVLDVITVGAFAKHSGKHHGGGLIKLLQEPKESPSKFVSGNACKVRAANDAVQAIKQLRKEIVDIMSQLLHLAKSKSTKGMMALCSEMVVRTRTLLNIWEPNLVEEAFAFVEQHRIIEEPDNVIMPMSPFRKITQQLSALELKSPELEDFATPVVAPPDLWPRTKLSAHLGRSQSYRLRPSPSASDIDAIRSIQRTVQSYNEQLKATSVHIDDNDNDDDDDIHADNAFQSLPVSLHNNESHLMTATDFRSSNVDEMQVSFASPPLPVASPLQATRNADEMTPSRCSFNSRGNIGFLDTKTMSTSPSANYYRPTEEPEPLDLTQLNIEASVMCLVSKIKFLCGRCGSPAIRLRHPKTTMKRAGFTNTPAPDVVVSQSVMCATDVATNCGRPPMESKQRISNGGSPLSVAHLAVHQELPLDITKPVTTDIVTKASPPSQSSPQERSKKGNKFTDGLNLSLTTDWVSELRPSMRKLRHAMDGLLKTARLMHSVQRLQQDMKWNNINLDVMFRRDVCFSQALTALISGLMATLWGGEVTENFIQILNNLGPLAYFEGLVSLYGGEAAIWGDMCIAIEDLSAVDFTLIRSNLKRDCVSVPTPRVNGSRQSIMVALPVPEDVYALIPSMEAASTFKVTPVFFNIGINEKATLAETLGLTRDQHRSNCDNFVRLKQYYNRFRKLNLMTPNTPSKHEPHRPASESLNRILTLMDDQLRVNLSKNVKILHLAEDACRLMSGIRFTSCKSAKDRTGMAVTLEQCRVLLQEFHLPAKSLPHLLNTMRSEGTRMDNALKNIGVRKYAFNLPQVLSLPAMYKPPVGAYGKVET